MRRCCGLSVVTARVRCRAPRAMRRYCGRRCIAAAGVARPRRDQSCLWAVSLPSARLAALGYPRPHAELDERGVAKIVGEFSEPPDRSRSLYGLISETCTHRLLRGLVYSRSGLESVPLAYQPPEVRYCRSQLEEREQKALRITESLLRGMDDACLQRGATFALAVAPTPWQIHEGTWNDLLARYELDPADYARSGPQTRLQAFVAKQQPPIAFFDLQPAMEAESEEPLHYTWDQHWTEAGNARAAEALTPWLKGLLPE